MSGDAQPRKRKDKKRKKDDEDTVKETSSHVPKASAGAAQAAKEPGDIQMHIHSDHGTGGHWCAKVVFFILLTGLGALIGLIILENRGLSNEDTPLSESRYSEFFSGWVDETRQDDHHHEEILAAINQLDDHDEHDDEHDDHDDGEPYAEQDDHGDDDDDHDEDGHGHDDDEDDDVPAPKLDDDEVEEIVGEKVHVKVQHHAAAADDNDDDDDDDNDGDDDNDANDDEDDNDDEAVDNDDDDDDDDDVVDDEDDDNDNEPVAANNNEDGGDDDDDDDDVPIVEEDDDDDDDEADAIAREIDQIAEADDERTPFEEENLSNALNDSSNTSTTPQPEPVPPVTGETLQQQMDELVHNFNKLAQSLDVPKVEDATAVPVPVLPTKDDNEDDADDNDIDDDGDEEEIEAVTRGSQIDEDDDDDDAADDDHDDDDGNDFDEFVDNDGGEEEYLAKARVEQQRKVEQQAPVSEPAEESSLAVKVLVGVALLGAAYLLLPPPRAPTPKEVFRFATFEEKPSGEKEDATLPVCPASVPERQQINAVRRSNVGNATKEMPPVAPVAPVAPRSVLDDFVYAGAASHVEGVGALVEGNVILMEDETGELYSGDEEEYDVEEYEEEDVEEIELVEEVAEKSLILNEQEVGAFVPITFEDFNSMYRSPPEMAELMETAEVQPILPASKKQLTSAAKNSPLMRKKPPKGAVNKLIYGLHKDPIVIPSEPEPEPTNVSVKGEAKSVLTALLSEIPSPPTDPDHDPVVPFAPKPVFEVTGPVVHPVVREKHVEFRLPEPEREDDAVRGEPPDNGSKENLYVPEAEDEELFVGEEYEYEDEILYEDDDIDSVLLNQYGSDEEEEPISDENIPDDASDVDDSELMKRLEQKYGKLEPKANPELSDEDGGGGAVGGDDAPDDGWTKIPSRSDDDDQSYQEELRRAQRQLDENHPEVALELFDALLVARPRSIAALVGRAQALDALAEQRQSNAMLTDAIEGYRRVIELEKLVDDATLRDVAHRCINRIRFRGQHTKAIDIHRVLVGRFPDEPSYRNQLAVTYLMSNRLAEAKTVLHETLSRWIADGFALVHYGFVVKNLDQNMETAVQYLREGIATGDEGTQDGRFYFHLGDALQRLGRSEEAHAVYRTGAQKKLFLSMYQRSLYNVDSLPSRPIWTVEQTTYEGQLELIRSQWMAIRDEGLKLLNADGVFQDEAENLRDTGDWKQFELYSRGQRNERNCGRTPLTCRLVETFAAARTCKRGQIKFSVMHPGTHVWPHCGPTNCRIRAHLGLKVPKGTIIRVADKYRTWANGKWLIFDDSFEHEVWHNGTGTRLVLIVDFWHPELTDSQRRTLAPI